ncbi:MAG: DUF484 family protein [Candidatus Nitricoxidivorans perseverans]|uniref:DUF484 family protein n=1 Tax=Candidatus Nitricoxidivorans perseverans TaxID=2975601 RepID=A0AA49FKV0_9PROT|nr:MAG: DUF484 family protein [Candidatus Nitricoxidivorans perseverans]
MNPDEIASYLKSHPEFFDRHADLLAQIHIPSPHGGRAISITERQIVTLRDRSRQLEAKLAELIRFGEENDAIAEKVHRLGVALMGAEDLQSAMRFLYAHLGGSFAVPHVAVRLWGVGSGDAAEFDPVADDIKALAGGIRHPYCGAADGQAAVEWLGDHGGHVRSVAQIPLREGGQHGGACFGLMLLASEEPHRFYPDMGTLYLERIGDMAAVALLRVVG